MKRSSNRSIVSLKLRGADNFAKVLDAIPKLLECGIRVRLATTVEDQTEGELARRPTRDRSDVGRWPGR